MVGVRGFVNSRKSFVVSALLIMLALSGILAAIYRAQHADPGVQALQAVKSRITYPLYYPKQLPSGYRYKDGSLNAVESVIVFVIAGPKNQQIAVTEQAKPNSYDFSQLSGTVEFQTPIGSAYIEDFNNRTTGSIVTAKTWIIANTYTTIGVDELRMILNSFQQY